MDFAIVSFICSYSEVCIKVGSLGRPRNICCLESQTTLCIDSSKVPCEHGKEWRENQQHNVELILVRCLLFYTLLAVPQSMCLQYKKEIHPPAIVCQQPGFGTLHSTELNQGGQGFPSTRTPLSKPYRFA